MFSGATQSGCGFAQAAMGPFYCPDDQKVYLDTSFFKDLERRFGACDVGSKTCQFAQAYVIAHEIGHHLQNQLGLLPQVQQKQGAMGQAEANSLQVRVELQADCLAGAWANRAQAKWQFIEPGDVEAAMQTASAIGDDRLQAQAQGYVVPDVLTPRHFSTTHALVHDCSEVRRPVQLQHVSQRRAVSWLQATLRNAALPGSNGTPNEQHNDCPDGCPNKTSTFACAIPA